MMLELWVVDDELGDLAGTGRNMFRLLGCVYFPSM